MAMSVNTMLKLLMQVGGLGLVALSVHWDVLSTKSWDVTSLRISHCCKRSVII